MGFLFSTPVSIGGIMEFVNVELAARSREEVMNPQHSQPSATPHRSTPHSLGDSLAAAYGPKAPVGNIVRIAVTLDEAVVDLSQEPLSKLETLIRSTIKKVIDKKGKQANYKIVLNENREGLAELHFVAEDGKLLGRAEGAALVRLVPTGKAGRYRISELRDASRQEIGIPPASRGSEEADAGGGGTPAAIEDILFEELLSPPQPLESTAPAPRAPEAIRNIAPPPRPAEPVQDAAPTSRGGEPAQEVTPARRAAEQALRGTGAEAAKRAVEQAMTAEAKAKETADKIRPDAVLDSEIESLLQKKHKEVVATRLKDEKQRGNVNAEITWASKMLDTVRVHRQKPANAGKALLCELLRDTINTGKSVPTELRNSVVAFCEEVADKGRGKAAAYAEQILEEFGWRQREEKLDTMYQHVTLQQILQRLEPDKPIDIQNKGLKQLSEFVHRQAGALRRVSDQGRRNQIVGECTAAMRHAAATRAFQALPALDRKQLKTNFTRAEERLNRSVTQSGRQPPPKK